MVTMPQKPYNEYSALAPEVYEAMAKNQSEDRRYLGISSIGRPCLRETWFGWRGFTPTPWDGRVLMIFEMGHHVEQIAVKALRLAGYQIDHAYPDKQFEVFWHGGLMRGHLDGLIKLWVDGREQWCLLEIKSSNSNKFEEFRARGCKAISPTYYAQTQGYMFLADLDACLFVVLCKDGSQIHAEIIKRDKTEGERVIEIGRQVLTSHDQAGNVVIPARISEDRKSQDCKWCRYQTACWDEKEAVQTKQECRSCRYFQVGSDWRPRCCNDKHKVEIKDFTRGCPDWAWVWRA